MTENIKTSAEAINKWFYFSLNYEVKFHNTLATDIKEFDGILLPTFITEIKWGCGLAHMVEKWQRVEDLNSYSRMNEFYSSLDNGNRKLLLEWVMQNYNSEAKLTF